MPWVDEMDWDSWVQYPNTCGAAALYMFLRGEGMVVDYPTLVQQLKAERPGGLDPYCGSDATGWPADIPTPTPDPTGWSNPDCVSAETLADVGRKYYGMAIR